MKGDIPLADKDATEKLLEDHNDVFADISNQRYHQACT